MALTSGTRLGHYEITDQLGKGGMGEVYRARDTKLGREVAIKVLPAQFAQDEERLARLDREARMLASLNHPNIAAIYGLEQSEDTRFLVLELVEGDTLADRLELGAIPVEDSLKLAVQVAEALEAAHEKGVIHRDLKPANIKVTPDGKVKVLDFGLAKAFAGDAIEADPSNSPTLSMQATQQGVILGTAAYMSPEQASGGSTDKRADIWALGVVLAEMLTGRPIFTGDTISHILAAVLAKEPNWDTLPSNLNPRIPALLERCLDKEPKHRWQAVGDLRYELKHIIESPGGVWTPEATDMAQAPPRSLPWAAAIVGAVLATGIAVWVLKPSASDPRPVMRFAVGIPADQTPGPVVPVMDLSPDGRRLAYVGRGNSQIYLRNLDEAETRPIQGISGLSGTPTFSPDGDWIAYAFQTGMRLMKVPVTGGTPQPIFEGLATSQLEMSWDDRDILLFTQPDGIWQVPANGGTADLLIAAEAGEMLSAPVLLPDGDSVLFSSATTGGITQWDTAQIVVFSLSSGDRKVVWSGGSDAHYVPTGHLVYAVGSTLMAIPFDLDRLEATGDSPARIAEGLVRSGAAHISSANYAIGSGILASLGSTDLLADPGGDLGSVAAISLDGNVETISADVRRYRRPRISPDGTQIAVEVGQESTTGSQVWIIDVTTGIGEQLTFEGTINQLPVWTPDGESVVFASNRIDGSLNALFLKEANGESAAVRVYEHDGPIGPTDLSSGGILAFNAPGRGQYDIWTVDIDDPESAQPFVATSGPDTAGRFSSDGNWLAYISTNETGDLRSYVRPYPDTGGVQNQVFDGFNVAPMWGPDDSMLYMLSIQTDPQLSATVASIPVRTGDGFSISGRPQLALTLDALRIAAEVSLYSPYDVMPDGQRLLMVSSTTGEETSPPQINVVVNWTRELLERVPTR